MKRLSQIYFDSAFFNLNNLILQLKMKVFFILAFISHFLKFNVQNLLIFSNFVRFNYVIIAVCLLSYYATI